VNTRAGGEASLPIADRLRSSVTTTPYRFEAVPDASSDLTDGRLAGAAVLCVTEHAGM
jgi:hypothetical protein